MEEKISRRMRASATEDDKDQKLVITPYGQGLVLRTRQNKIKEIVLTEWNKSRALGSKQKRSNMLYSKTDFPSVKPEIGSDVISTFGRGKVIELRDDDKIVVVRLSSWRLAGRSQVTCYLSQDHIHVVRPHRTYEMNVHERIEYATKLKVEANSKFSTKDYEGALQLYAEAVDAVRYIQHRKDSTNFVR